MITRKELNEETRRIKELRQAGAREDYIRSWLRGWRMVGQARQAKK